jgi:prepilin peptidase CpaA
MIWLLLTCIVWGLVLAVYDLRWRRLPNALTIGGLLVVFAVRLGWGGVPLFLDGLAAMFVAGLVMLPPFAMHGAGGGDVKMMAAAAVAVGWVRLLAFFWYTALTGLVLAVVLLFASKNGRSLLGHGIHVLLDPTYDRRAGRAEMESKMGERFEIPLGVAIAMGLFVALVAPPVVELPALF